MSVYIYINMERNDSEYKNVSTEITYINFKNDKLLSNDFYEFQEKWLKIIDMCIFLEYIERVRNEELDKMIEEELSTEI